MIPILLLVYLLVFPRPAPVLVAPVLVSSVNLPAPPAWEGLASYYSRAGCLGCSKNFVMANGQPLDDAALTVAFNRVRLNTRVRVTNLRNNLQVITRVTDRGGFERYGKIIDLTLATRDALSCGNVCRVKVESLD